MFRLQANGRFVAIVQGTDLPGLSVIAVFSATGGGLVHYDCAGKGCIVVDVAIPVRIHLLCSGRIAGVRRGVLVQVLRGVVNLFGRYYRGRGERWIALVQHRIWTSGMVVHRFLSRDVRVVGCRLIAFRSDVVVLRG